LRFDSGGVVNAGEIRFEADPLAIAFCNALATRFDFPLASPISNDHRVSFTAQPAEFLKHSTLQLVFKESIMQHNYF
jgi:hypothetical protein